MMKRVDKRPLEKDGNDGVPEEKRQRVPALASVIVEAVKMDSLQKLCSSLEPLLRRVVGEEVERALAKLAPTTMPARLPGRSSPKRIQGSNERYLRLQFRSKLALPLFTGSKVEGEQGSSIHVVLQDAATGQVLIEGNEASIKLDVIVLEGDFSADDEQDWTQEEFEQNVVRERDGKRPLLTGDLTVTLKEGVGTLGELTFTDNSSWIRSRKFRLGVKLASGQLEGLRIREAKTEAFTVKDHRGELYKKHYPPALHDEVWRLDRIGKDGAFHKRLNQAGIFTVEDFLRLVVMDPQKLRNILGSGMSNKMWEGTVEHAKTCVLNGKLHVYYADDKQNIGVIFNNIFQLMGLIADGQYMSVDLLSESEKIYVDKLVKVAYENWENVVEYDGEALIGVKPYNLRGLNTVTEDPGGAPSSNIQGRSREGGGASTEPNSQQLVSRDFFNTTKSFMDQTPNDVPLAATVQANASMGDSEQPGALASTEERSAMTLGPEMGLGIGQPTSDREGGNTNLASFLGLGQGSAWDRPDRSELALRGGMGAEEEAMMSEDELRAKSMELLSETEDMRLDMQQLLGMLGDMNGASGGVGVNVPNDSIEDLIRSFNVPGATTGEDHLKTSHGKKAAVGWLKIKAALRWGIFIRKRAAQRRAQMSAAQLEEVEEGDEGDEVDGREERDEDADENEEE